MVYSTNGGTSGNSGSLFSGGGKLLSMSWASWGASEVQFSTSQIPLSLIVRGSHFPESPGRVTLHSAVKFCVRASSSISFITGCVLLLFHRQQLTVQSMMEIRKIPPSPAAMAIPRVSLHHHAHCPSLFTCFVHSFFSKAVVWTSGSACPGVTEIDPEV